jgi:neutral amino acid transport system ATP-binding protein
MSLLEVDGLVKDFGGLRAVDGATFTVEEGSITSLIGPNGAGKTTAFNLISGTLRPTAGTVRFAGRQINGQRPHRITRMGISRTFQITRELGDLTVLENMVVQSPISGVRALFGRSVLDRELHRATELLEFLGIDALASEQAANLSYGQRKLLEFGAVLMTEPRLVLLDEPAGGVNPALLEDVVARIRELNAAGITFLVVEHNIDLVMRISDSIIVMAHGDVLLQDTPDVVQRDDAVLDAYLGKV